MNYFATRFTCHRTILGSNAYNEMNTIIIQTEFKGLMFLKIYRKAILVIMMSLLVRYRCNGNWKTYLRNFFISRPRKIFYRV